jgi:hypothetical protein
MGDEQPAVWVTITTIGHRRSPAAARLLPVKAAGDRVMELLSQASRQSCHPHAGMIVPTAKASGSIPTLGRPSLRFRSVL